jgi:hypothetical protein
MQTTYHDAAHRSTGKLASLLRACGDARTASASRAGVALTNRQLRPCGRTVQGCTHVCAEGGFADRLPRHREPEQYSERDPRRSALRTQSACLGAFVDDGRRALRRDRGSDGEPIAAVHSVTRAVCPGRPRLMSLFMERVARQRSRSSGRGRPGHRSSASRRRTLIVAADRGRVPPERDQSIRTGS